MNNSRKTGLLRLRHLMETTEAVGEEMDTERERFQRLASKESAPRVVSAFNLFQTPEPIADRMATMLPLEGRILEPSAGLGRLYRAIRFRSSCHVTLVEMSAACCSELYRETEDDSACRLVQGDFLECTAEGLGTFDGIVMNPPFKMGRDIKHIKHAVTLLNPGGRLVSLCAAGPRQRKHLQPLGEWIDLPSGSFKSEGTRVDSAIVVIDADSEFPQL